MTTTSTRGATAMLVTVLTIGAVAGCSAGDGESGDQATTAAPTSASSSPSTSTASSQEPTPEETSMSENLSQRDREAIAANVQARQRAMVDGDTAELRQLSTPGSRSEHISGYDQPREEWFEQIESGYFDYHTIDDDSIDITPVATDAVRVVTRRTIDVTIAGSRNTWRLESTADYVRVDGRWLSGNSRSRML